MRKMTVWITVMIMAMFLVAPAMAETDQKEFPNPVADLLFSPQAIHFVPLVTYGSLEMRVLSPDGQLRGISFHSGQAPVFQLDANCPDGVYSYELIASSNRNPEKRTSGAANSGDSRLSERPSLQSGYFRVSGGTLVIPLTGPELSSPMDEVHLDDVIIDGSLCVGNDCLNGENFGFDTLRLKENNLRIRFVDTSTSASFPSNDWQIIANDSANGGANFFGIDDIDSGKRPFTIEAGTRANAIYVDDSGRVGLGTSTPSEDLHIWYGDTPTIRLAQSGAGWAPQTWDISGNEANFFIRDVTNGSKLPFRIQPNTPADTMCLKSNGFVGIGTWSPEYKFHVSTTGDNCIFVVDRTDGAQFKLAALSNKVQIGSQSAHAVRFTTDNTSRMAITATGNVGVGNDSPDHLFMVGASGAYCDGGAWVDGSSRAFKTDIRTLDGDEAAKAVMNLEPVRFRYKTNTSEEFLGFIAEDVPELVATRGRKGMTAMDVVAALTKVVQQQQKTIHALEKRLRKLEDSGKGQ